MRRLLLPLLSAALLASACTSTSGTRPTVTVVNTVTPGASSAAAAAGSLAPSSAGITVVGSTAPSGKQPSLAPSPIPSPTASGSPRPSPSANPSTGVTKPAAVAKVDPLGASCPSLLSSTDIKKAINATVGTSNNRVRLGAGAHGVKGAIRCLYGSPDAGKTAPVRIRLTQYNSVASAQKQIGVDTQVAQDAGSTVSTVTVNGYPASLQVGKGGVVELRYDTWTMAIAVSDKVSSGAALTDGLPRLATQALSRLIKNG